MLLPILRRKMFLSNNIRTLFNFWFLLYMCTCVFADSQLLINVKNQGKDVIQETISSDLHEDTVTLEFKRSDGTLVTQLLDFRNEVHIMKALILGEEERGQSQYQVMCFVYHLNKKEFLSPDSMVKLREKNPGIVRTPEEDKGVENYTMDTSVNVAKSVVLSPHIKSLCAEARDATYTRESDIATWAAKPGASLSSLLGIVTHNSHGNRLKTEAKSDSRCFDTVSLWSPCLCHLEICISWYPCGIKYCKVKGENRSSSGSYRCGIRTCKKCSVFLYNVKKKQLCLWDE